MKGIKGKIKRKVQIDIMVVYFYHQQRPVEADKDCLLVQDIFRSYQIPWLVEDWDTTYDTNINKSEDNPNNNNTFAASSSSFSQEKVRIWRCPKLQEQIQTRIHILQQRVQQQQKVPQEQQHRVPFGIIMTAHHQDDSYETVLIKLLMGVHLNKFA